MSFSCVFFAKHKKMSEQEEQQTSLPKIEDVPQKKIFRKKKAASVPQPEKIKKGKYSEVVQNGAAIIEEIEEHEEKLEQQQNKEQEESEKEDSSSSSSSYEYSDEYEEEEEEETSEKIEPPQTLAGSQLWQNVLHGDFDEWLQQLSFTLKTLPGAMLVPGVNGINEFGIQLLLQQSLLSSMCSEVQNIDKYRSNQIQIVPEAWLMRFSKSKNDYQWQFGYLDLWLADHSSKRAVLVEIKYERMAYMRYSNGKPLVNLVMRNGEGEVRRDEEGNVERIKENTYRYRTAHAVAAEKLAKSAGTAINVQKMKRFDPARRVQEPLHALIEKARSAKQVGSYLEGLSHQHEWPTPSENGMPDKVARTFSEAKKARVGEGYTLHTVYVLVYGNRVYYEADRLKTKIGNDGALQFKKSGSTFSEYVE